MGSKRDVDVRMGGADRECLIEFDDGHCDMEALRRYAKIGEAVFGIAEKGVDAEVRKKGDGSYAIYAVEKNKVTV